ncbi:MAG: ABC transporter permease [Deltaproteobacteria bacterium]|jgi:spermidine/putrescine transport system permease protein|nr:ABC transporter permease [Deltaproteobacteria bacterium]
MATTADSRLAESSRVQTASPETSGEREMKRRHRFQVATYLGPIMFVQVLFVLAPLSFILMFSILKTGPYGNIVFELTLENYRNLLDTGYATVFFKSIYYALQTNLVCILLSYPLAYYIARYGGRWKAGLLLLIVIPSWTAYIIRLYALKTILGSNGLINNLLIDLGVIHLPIQFLYTSYAVSAGLVYTWLPFMVLPLYAALEGLDPSLWEAATDLGATPVRRFFRVTLPLTRGGLLAGTLLVFIPSLGDWLVPHLLGGSKFMMAGTLVAHKFTAAGDIPGGSCLAAALAFVLLLLIYFVIRFGGRESLEQAL